MLSKAIFNTDTNSFIQPKGLFKCTDKRGKICLFYINEGNRFVMPSNMRWKLRSQVFCRGINVIYYKICNMYNHKEKYIGKTVGNIIVGFKFRINQNISDCRTGISTCKLSIQLYHYIIIYQIFPIEYNY